MKIAIIGAGLAGLACARALVAGGATVRLFDKGRAPGGRVATRRATVDGAARAFDHGAQYVTIRGAGFAAALGGAPVAPWPDPERWVGIPGMSALPRHLATGLEVSLGCEIRAIGGAPGAWALRHGDTTAGPFDAVVVAIPPAQAVALVGPVAPALPPRLGGVRMAPCWTAMAAFSAKLALPDTSRPIGSPIGWAARDSAKPGRGAGEAWVVQATAEWSRTHLETTPELAAAALLDALAAQAGGALPPTLHLAGHRWRHATVERPLGAPFLWDPGLRLGLAGDWCIAARAEAAFDSGAALAAAILG